MQKPFKIMSAVPSNVKTEKFMVYHKDCKISNKAKTVENWYSWSYHRTCYGAFDIPSTLDYVATWTVKVERCSADSGWVCVGVDTAIQTDTWFYGHRNEKAPNYGYEVTGKVYANGQSKAKKDRFKSGDHISVTLDVPRGVVRFYKNKWLENPPQFTFSIVKGPGIIYKLAVALKDAQVSIIGFEYELKSESKPLDQEDLKETDPIQNPLTKNLNSTTIKHTVKDMDHDIDSLKVAEEFQSEYKGLRSIIPALNTSHSMSMGDIAVWINGEMKLFKDRYNKQSLQRLRDEDPMNLVDAQSTLNMEITSISEDIRKVMEHCNAFKDYLTETQGMIDDLSTPDVTQYESWNVGTMVLWISGLENGRYRKYGKQIESALVSSEIVRGEYLPDLNESILSITPFNIKSFPDKRDLVRHFKALSVNTSDVAIEDPDVAAVPSAESHEGTKTVEYIDR